MFKRIINIIIFIIISFHLILYLFVNKERFLRSFNPEYFGELYSNSQYVLGPKSIGGIGDDGLYAFAGYYYFFQKGDVSSVNFEHPPLGKYLIGLSIFLFNNENVINIIYFFFLLMTVYLLGKLIFKDTFWSILPLVILSFDPLLLDHLIRSQLDLPFTLFFVAAVYFFIKALEKPRFYWLSHLFWGASFSTRFFPFLLVFYLLFFTFVLQTNKKHLKIYIVSSFIIPFMYFLSHFAFFIYHPSINEFIRHKIWMLSWFKGTPIKFGNLIRNIYSGWYYTSENILRLSEHWLPIIPVVTSAAILVSLKELKERIHQYLFILSLIFLTYLFYLTILTGGNLKFFMPVYPLASVLAIRCLQLFYSIIALWINPTPPK